jgi:hypothetical protein
MYSAWQLPQHGQSNPPVSLSCGFGSAGHRSPNPITYVRRVLEELARYSPQASVNSWRPLLAISF